MGFLYDRQPAGMFCTPAGTVWPPAGWQSSCRWQSSCEWTKHTRGSPIVKVAQVELQKVAQRNIRARQGGWIGTYTRGNLQFSRKTGNPLKIREKTRFWAKWPAHVAPRDHRIHLGRRDSPKSSSQNHSLTKLSFSGPIFDPKKVPAQKC